MTLAFTLVAQADFFGGNSQKAAGNLLWYLVGALVALTIATMWIGLRWTIRQRAKNSSGGVFQELCAAHGLNRREQGLLRRLACHYRLTHPAALFVDPSLWESEGLDGAWKKQGQALRGLKERLFARA
jgi:hypothetical protein